MPSNSPARSIRSLLAPILVAVPLAVASLGALAAPGMARDGVLVDAKGMTLYTFDSDPAGAGKSECNGACAQNWPPLAAAASDKSEGDWSVITRADGTHQWAYKGKPVYTWSKDQKPGERTGDGFRGVWHVAKP
jgi:predicted lipoprotein with Yx(FWY)xxD motif